MMSLKEMIIEVQYCLFVYFKYLDEVKNKVVRETPILVLLCGGCKGEALRLSTTISPVLSHGRTGDAWVGKTRYRCRKYHPRLFVRRVYG